MFVELEKYSAVQIAVNQSRVERKLVTGKICILAYSAINLFIQNILRSSYVLGTAYALQIQRWTGGGCALRHLVD